MVPDLDERPEEMKLLGVVCTDIVQGLDTLGLIHHDLHFLKLVYDIKKDEIFANDTLSAHTANQIDERLRQFVLFTFKKFWDGHACL